jgi:undecaprenyl pyrophosphate phosphatase UppP
VGESSWGFLLVGSFAALGAAMAVGTLAAIVRYHRTGVFPGADTAQEPTEVTRSRLLALWVRVAVGVVLTLVGIAALRGGGLL